MKTILKTTICAVIGAVVASPIVDLTGTIIYPNNGQVLAQQTKARHKCKSPGIVTRTLTGAGVGAVGGLITGNTGQGALIGAGVGAADRRRGSAGDGALLGGAIGAAGGAITGNAGRGALIGAGTGAANRAIRGGSC